MKKKMMEGGPSAGPTNVVDKSYTSPPNPRPLEEIRDKVSTHEMDDESLLNKSARTTVTMDSARRHPFTNTIVEVPLPGTNGRVSTETDTMGLPIWMSIWNLHLG